MYSYWRFIEFLDNAYHSGWLPKKAGRKLCDYLDRHITGEVD